MTAVRTLPVAILLLTATPPDRLTAQVSFDLAAGARVSSTLVHDSIVTPVDLRPAIAPAFLAALRMALRGAWTADVTVDVTPSGLRRHEPGGAFEAGSFTAVAFTVGLQRTVAAGADLRAGLGGLRYLATERGVFREGTGGIFPLGTVTAAYALPFGARRRVRIEARYDVHRFITPALRTEGFSDPRFVHRLALLARTGWGP